MRPPRPQETIQHLFIVSSHFIVEAKIVVLWIIKPLNDL